MNNPVSDPVISDPELLCPQDDAPIEEAIYAPEPKKGKLWPPALILFVLLAVGLLLFFLIPDPADTVTDAAMPWFTLQDGRLCFDQSKYTGGTEIAVPAYIRGQAVTAISDGCFAGCDWIVTVQLPEGVQTLGSHAFADCTALRGIKLPETLSEISENAFSGCSALEAICIPYSVTQIGTGSFAGCMQLSHVFYTGPMSSWAGLRVLIPNSDVRIYCYDGIYPQQ